MTARRVVRRERAERDIDEAAAHYRAEGGRDLERVLLFYGIFRKLVIGPEALARNRREGAQDRNQEEFQSHDRLILVDRQAAGQAKTGYRRGLAARPEKIAFS